MALDEEKIGQVISEVGCAAIRLLEQGHTITKEVLIEELERYRKEVTNTLHKAALRDVAQEVRDMK